jgi:hypothetical protein
MTESLEQKIVTTLVAVAILQWRFTYKVAWWCCVAIRFITKLMYGRKNI